MEKALGAGSTIIGGSGVGVADVLQISAKSVEVFANNQRRREHQRSVQTKDEDTGIVSNRVLSARRFVRPGRFWNDSHEEDRGLLRYAIASAESFDQEVVIQEG